MKKCVSLLLIMVIAAMPSLCGCSNTEGSIGQSTNADYLLIEFVNDSRATKQIGELIIYTEHWKATNNTGDTINGVSISVCYCDKDGNIVYTDTRTSEVLLQPGQSIELSSSCNQAYASSYVSNYEYKDGNRWIDADCMVTSKN